MLPTDVTKAVVYKQACEANVLHANIALAHKHMLGVCWRTSLIIAFNVTKFKAIVQGA